jgi:hypothetical protein
MSFSLSWLIIISIQYCYTQTYQQVLYEYQLLQFCYSYHYSIVFEERCVHSASTKF